MSNPRVLVYTSSADRVPTREGEHPCGTWLSELVEPLGPLFDAGCDFDFTTPDGRPCHLDEASLKLMYWGLSKKRLGEATHFVEQLKDKGFSRPTPLAIMIADTERLASYDLLFIPGGLAPMTDVLYRDWAEGEELNADTGTLLQCFHDREKPTALICHAPAVLAAAPYVDDRWLYDGYEMTCVSRMAEYVAEDLPFLGSHQHLKEYPTELLKRHGGKVRQVMLGGKLVVEDRELITAQDPVSGRELGKRLLSRLLPLMEESSLEPAAKIGVEARMH